VKSGTGALDVCWPGGPNGVPNVGHKGLDLVICVSYKKL
jgi:hypothetical protein